MSKIKLLVLSAWASRVITAIAGIFSIRILNNQLPVEEYAIYIVIMGISGWFAIIGDPGIGYQTQNKVSEKIAIGKNYSIDILSAYILLFSVAIFIFFLSYILRNPITFFLFEKLDYYDRGSLSQTFLVVAFIYSIGMAASVSSKFLYATGKGAFGNMLTAFGSLLGLLILHLGLKDSHNKILYSVIAVTIPGMTLSVFLAIHQIKKSWNSLNLITFNQLLSVVKNSRGFFFFSLVAASIIQVDYLIMSQKIKPIEIAQYYNLAKIFSFLAFINQSILYALWPDFTQKFIRNEFKDIKNSIKKVILLTSVFTLITTIILILTSKYFGIIFKSGDEIIYRNTVIFGFGFIALLRCISDPCAIFLQSINNLRPIIICAAVQAPISFLLQWIFSTYFSIEGIILGFSCAFLMTAFWVQPFLVMKKLGKL